ncbi:drebrin-like protein B isoform X2 [Genypterus blacodes]|uniref:drebrin-like protein B isoform X2 n=1 Tax=Genypterus blacodes TaxID=154954 RepID=UPI003F760E6F
MTVNLSKNGAALMAAYKEVVDGRSDTNWALFTYEGNSNDIRLAEKGDGGLEEMVEELNSGKVMYAFCRVQDPNSGLPKYVLINWSGEGVKDTRKGICANHVGSMSSFLKGAHVTINARGEDDVEPEVILDKVAKASGANFNFHKETKQQYREGARGAVGSVYRKTNAVEEIQNTNKDDFWARNKRDEEVRRDEESRRAERERERRERERKEQDQREAKEREKSAKERALQIDQEKIYQREREAEEREREEQREEKENRRKGVAFAASVQKANEAKSMIAERTFDPRDVFRQREQSFEVQGGGAPPAASRPGKLQSPFLSQRSSERASPPQPRYPASSAALTRATPTPPLLPAAPAQPPSPVQSSFQVWSPSPVRSPSLGAASPPLPGSHGSPVQAAGAAYTEEEEEWSDEFDDDAEEVMPVNPGQEEDLYEPLPSAGTEEEDIYEDVSSIAGDAEGQGICARALYDYQAVDDTEITLDPDDIITGIEMVDEGWWRGFGPDGRYGMFPANYVERL